MSLIVQKYGGSSVAGAEKILSVARRIGAVRQAGTDVSEQYYPVKVTQPTALGAHLVS